MDADLTILDKQTGMLPLGYGNNIRKTYLVECFGFLSSNE